MIIRNCCPWLHGGLALLGLGATLLLAACAPVGPGYQPPKPELPVAWSGAVAESANPAGREVLGHWWTLFNDPLLDSLIQRAVAANRDLKIAEARVQQARAQYRLTTAVAAPTVGVSGAYTNSRKSENGGSNGSGGATQDLFQTGFDAGWELDIFGGARRGAEAAEARLVAAGENSTDVQVTLAAEVARNYLELRGSQQRLGTARANLAGQEKTLALAKGRREAGLGNELEVAQAETQLALTRAQLPPLENSVGQSSYRLALLLGRSPQDLQVELAPVGLPIMPAGLPETLPSDLLRRRPDIRRAERLLAAATADIGVATAELFPRFSLTGLVGLQSLNLSDLLSTSSRYWTVGPTVRWAVFDGGRVRANIDLNKGRREEAQAVYEKTVLTALSEVESALLALAREEESRRTFVEVVASGQRAVELASGRYRAGLAGVLEVLLGERDLYQSQDQLVQSEQRRGVALVVLCKALGGGWEVGADHLAPADGPVVKDSATLPLTPSGDLQK